ncbi:hypothetical protein K474DRAFT_1587496 [Panus rudis PR-1116 ss-1]|nr:hypothetical protein K474DRAFT_1587496 [Panus rudis PR-1116 ss-1]
MILVSSVLGRIHGRPVPPFVLEFAPISHLWSQETWFPSDISTHLTHVSPQINFTDVAPAVTFTNISALGADVFLTSKDPIDASPQPAWMVSTENKPDGKGRSGAPATIILVEKDGGILDAFYFYFYSFDEGNGIYGLNFTSHVGDWEHSMVRFVNRVPQTLYLSAHSGGFAFNYTALNFTKGRPTTFIAGGTHANYPNPGSHFHGTMNLLNDRTDAGPLWDVTLNFRAYWFDNATRRFSLASGGGLGGGKERGEGVGWLEFEGMWGDKQYPVPEHGQFCIEGNCRWGDGPTGPIAKNLGRVQVCQDETNCTIQSTIT